MVDAPPAARPTPGSAPLPLNQLGRLYAQALAKTVQAKRPARAPDSAVFARRRDAADDPGHKTAPARELARDAIYRMAQDSLNDLPIMRRTRELIQRFGTVDVRVDRHGEVLVNHSSPFEPVAAPDATQTLVHSRVMIGEGTDLALIWETAAGPFRSRLSYRARPGILTMVLGAALGARSGLEIGVRQQGHVRRADAALSFALP